MPSSQNAIIKKLFLTTLILAFGACQSRGLGPYTTQDLKSNLYYQRVQKLGDRDFIQRVSSSLVRILRVSQNDFYTQLRNEAYLDPYLDALPQGWIHGDFHVSQIVQRNGVVQIDDWDTFSKGPFWSDVLRLEISSQLAHQERGFRETSQLSCWPAYRKHILSPQQEIANYPIPLQADSFEMMSDHPLWTESVPLAEDSKFVDEIRSWLKSTSHMELASAPFRNLRVGVGSYHLQKVLILDEKNNQLWELKEVEPQPLKEWSKDSPQGCERYEHLQADKLHACWEDSQGRIFTLLEWSHSYASAGPRNWSSHAELQAHVEWSCAQLAQWHHQHNSESQAWVKWINIVHSEEPYLSRHISLTHKITNDHIQAQRMLQLR